MCVCDGSFIIICFYNSFRFTSEWNEEICFMMVAFCLTCCHNNSRLIGHECPEIVIVDS